MDNYVSKIHEIIEKVNPQLYVDSSMKSFTIYALLAVGMFVFGLLIYWLFKVFPKLEKFAGDFGQDLKTMCLGIPIALGWLLLISYQPPIKDTLSSKSKSLVSEYVGNLSNDDYIGMEKQVRAYGHQVSLDSELERAVNNYLLEILDK